MPDDEVLAAMYGSEYGALTSADYDVDSPRDTEAVLGFLNDHKPGTILDFGCGQGDLIRAIQRDTAWKPTGVEWDPGVSASVQARTGARVFTYADLVAGRVPLVDAVHLGDVIEHLTELDRQIPLILSVVRPGGYVLAEGPLECGRALFEVVVRVTQAARAEHPVSAPPTHVLQASIAGQRGFFARHGLTERAFKVYEVDWPAPSRLRRQDLHHPRTLALYLLRRLSAPLSRRPLWGNRYQYVGSL